MLMAEAVVEGEEEDLSLTPRNGGEPGNGVNEHGATSTDTAGANEMGSDMATVGTDISDDFGFAAEGTWVGGSGAVAGTTKHKCPVHDCRSTEA